MKVHVMIPTLQGLAAVQQITREDPEIPSVVCLNGTSQSLPISSAYYDFVKKGQGVIARDFDHPAWRVDLSAGVETGNSWQLPLYLAHLFEAQQRLGNGQPKAGDTVVWATGAVKVNGDVEPVDGVERKLEQSRQQLTQWQQAAAFRQTVDCPVQTVCLRRP